MDGAPVQLCDHARTAPETVDLDEPAAQGDGNVQLRLRQAPVDDEPQEALLQLAPGERGPDATRREDHADRPRPAPARVALEQGGEGEGVDVAAGLRPVH